jgi:hypothetical protein
MKLKNKELFIENDEQIDFLLNKYAGEYPTTVNKLKSAINEISEVITEKTSINQLLQNICCMVCIGMDVVKAGAVIRKILDNYGTDK